MALARLFNTIILFFLFSILVAQDPPANDDPSGAVLITVQKERCSSRTEGTTGGTDSTAHNSSSCLSSPNYSNGPKNPIDVWYKATTPSSGSITFELGRTNEGFISNPVFVAYEKEGDSYKEIDCATLVGNNSYAKIELTGRSEGEMIYIQVADNNQIEYENNGTGSFKICAYEPSSLDFAENHTPMLSYYSNPVGNHLVVESPYEIQSLSVYDLRGKAVLHKTPNQQNLRLQTYMLAAGAYVLRVETPAGQQNVQLIKK